MSLVPVLDLLGLPAPVSPALPEGVLGVQVLGTRVAYEIGNIRELPVVIPVYSSREAGPWGRPRDQEVFEVGLSPAQTR